MSGFRIIALKICDNGFSDQVFLPSTESTLNTNYLKNLKPNSVYKFYDHYSFPNNSFEEIHYNPENDLNLYSIKLSNNKNIPVCINAIVGENGSGKSTLIELLYWANYNLGCKFGLLESKEEPYEKYLLHETLDLELFYSVNAGEHYVLKFKKGEVFQAELHFKNNHFKRDSSNWIQVKRIDDLKDFFYSVVINYSQYALNSLEVGDWITPLFHKNDGYQTPIVLNPMRTNGNIDVNKERLLLSRRLQANVLEPFHGEKEDSLRNLANGKIAKTIKAVYNKRYLFDKPEISHTDFDATFFAIASVFELKFPETIVSPEYDLAHWKTEEEQLIFDLISITVSYVYLKLLKIANSYSEYFEYKRYDGIERIEGFLGSLKKSDSHITYKVKGAILHLKYYKEIYKELKDDGIYHLNIDKFSKVIKKIKKSEPSFAINTFIMAMPSFYNVEIITEDNQYIGPFSSGEKQQIYSLSSIAYHLINLNSVEKKKARGQYDISAFTKYSYINIILDEIELYYHPEWQRTYIATLLAYLGKIAPSNLNKIKAINIIFVTHSPYILSDIPSSNIIRMENGNQENNRNYQETFGANIHDLLEKDFFMKNGAMGEWAKKKINEIVEYITYSNLLKEQNSIDLEVRKVAENSLKEYSEDQITIFKSTNRINILKNINVIGEPVIKGKLLEMYDGAFSTNNLKENLQKEIDRLTTLMNNM